MKNALLILAAILAFVGLLTYLTLSGRKVKYEVCMEYNGRRACAIASAETPELAQRTAVDNACGQIAFGVTETMQCTRSRPASLRQLGD